MEGATSVETIGERIKGQVERPVCDLCKEVRTAGVILDRGQVFLLKHVNLSEQQQRILQKRIRNERGTHA
jgi:hypothetical protein